MIVFCYTVDIMQEDEITQLREHLGQIQQRES